MVKFIAVFQNKLKNSYITFSQENPKSEVIVNGNIKNLKKGKHGFHIHEKGNLTKTDCSKCEGHWNPTNKQHGGRNDTNSHAGDFGNITSNDKNESKFHFTTKKITLFGKYSIIGRSVIIHEDEDDLGLGNHHDSLTTGHSGSRIDCAVIGHF
jgi:Cu-Zn family superoxide dismutase